MGLCISKDLATWSRNEAGEIEINRYLSDVKPGENIQPRLDRLTSKAIDKMTWGRLPYEQNPCTQDRNLQNSFQNSYR